MRARKSKLLANLKARARALQERWGGKRLKEWLALDLTNAHLLALVTYNSGMSQFGKLLKESEAQKIRTRVAALSSQFIELRQALNAM